VAPERSANRIGAVRAEIVAGTNDPHAVTVRDVMSTDVVSVAPETPVQEIAATLARRGISSVSVVNGAGRLVGIVSEGDLIRRAEIGTAPHQSWWRPLLTDTRTAAQAYVRSHGRMARDVMTMDLVTAAPHEPLHQLAARMARKGLRRLPVLRDGSVIGTIARSDLVRELGNRSPVQSHASDETLRTEVMARIHTLPWNLQLRFDHADVQNGVATLYGWAASPLEKRALEIVAENTPGIRRVRNCVQSVLPYV
jgi:CBS domain-containing protein